MRGKVDCPSSSGTSATCRIADLGVRGCLFIIGAFPPLVIGQQNNRGDSKIQNSHNDMVTKIDERLNPEKIQAIKQHEIGDVENAAFSVSSLEGAAAFERRLVWKLDLYILPMLSIIFFLAQMGRTDIANAQIAGLDEDLDIAPPRYANIVTVFIVGHIAFLPAGTMMLRFLTPSVQLGGAMIIWGVITVL
jgi:hypothetical protein